MMAASCVPRFLQLPLLSQGCLQGSTQPQGLAGPPWSNHRRLLWEMKGLLGTMPLLIRADQHAIVFGREPTGVCFHC